MKKIILHSESMLGRGDVTNAINMYKMIVNTLMYDAKIVVPHNNKYIDLDVIKQLASKEYQVSVYHDQQELEAISKKFKTTHAYFMKSGLYDGRYIRGIPSFIHAVFRDFQPHGDVYAFASKWLLENVKSKPNALKWYRHYPKFISIKVKSSTPYFPDRRKECTWMGHPLPPVTFGVSKKFKAKYGIQEKEKIVTRFGGVNDFNDPAGEEAVRRIVESTKSIKFYFIRTRKFIDHPRAVFIDNYISEEEKSQLINASSVLLNCRLRGESFGFTICEALSRGRPIIGPGLIRNPMMDAHHIELLSRFDLLYESSQDLINKIHKNIELPPEEGELIESVKEFGFEGIANRFSDIFLSKY